MRGDLPATIAKIASATNATSPHSAENASNKHLPFEWWGVIKMWLEIGIMILEDKTDLTNEGTPRPSDLK